ncbi:MAG: complex I NDUFA9 subunit family protein [Rhodospirillaceae bacterium]|nr:complex I NDUFA9 subunit family protein [Rhodospirillaceae bacterium]
MANRSVTIFGGSGFVGRYVVQQLARRDWVIRVAARRPAQAQFLKPLGHVGQITPVAANIRDDASVAACIEGSDAVVNLVGILYSKGRQSFEAVHVDGAKRIATAARNAGASRLIQMSALGANQDSIADYARSKAGGEIAVREAFPGATIVRPSIIFGPEDSFFNRFAGMARIAPALPLIGGGKTRFQPVYVGDVAAAIATMLDKPETAGRTYELGGPETLDFRALMERMLVEIDRRRVLVPVPFWAASLKASFLGLLPVPPLTRDQVRLLRSDNIVGGSQPGFASLGIEPTAMTAILPTYLRRYRRGAQL